MSQRPSDPLPTLIIQHAPHEHAAALRRALQSQGTPIHVVRIWEGETLPDPQSIGGLISLGGHMGANDEADHPWILDEIRLMRKIHDSRLPIAGICLGGQMLARALGGKVSPNPHPEIGWFEVKLNDHGLGDPLMSASGPTPKFYQWHYDTFSPPPEGTVLAESSICASQAFRVGDRTYGFQFHPEADFQLVDEWLQIEGTDEEILLARIAHHQACVQTPSEHVANARSGELSSLSFVAAISQLFHEKLYAPIGTDLYARCEKFRDEATECVLHFNDSSGKTFPVAGRVERIVKIPRGHFLFLRETSGLVWPVRLDHIHAIKRLRE